MKSYEHHKVLELLEQSRVPVRNFATQYEALLIERNRPIYFVYKMYHVSYNRKHGDVANIFILYFKTNSQTKHYGSKKAKSALEQVT